MWTKPPDRTYAACAVAVVCAVVLVGGCSNDEAGSSTSSPPTIGSQASASTGVTAPSVTTAAQAPSTTGVTAPTVTTAAPTAMNPWYPLEPGYQIVELGTLRRGSRTLEHRRVLTVTNVTKVIDGVRATLVLDQNIDAGETAEQALDYVALAPDGSVVYLGSYTESYEGGQYVSAADAWLAGVNGVRGTLMPADPQPDSGLFTEFDVPGKETVTGKVLKRGESLCVPYDCYVDVLVLQEGDEYKYFAPGVGELKLEPHYSGGEQETLELINAVRLSSAGLAELSAEAARLDAHARETSPKVFGDSNPAEQLS